MNKNFNVDMQKWNNISRVAGFFAAIAIWWVSIRFSVAGFNFSIPGMEWTGWVLGLCVTVIEIVFNKPGVKKNLTLWIVGAMAYCYGMWTNIWGIWLAQGSQAGAEHWIFPAVLGSALEWIPEVLLVWALLGAVTSEGDFLGNLIGMFRKDDGYANPPSRPQKATVNWEPPVKRAYPRRPTTSTYQSPSPQPPSSWDDELGNSLKRFQESNPYMPKGKK